MAFVRKRFEIGDRVILNTDMETSRGTFERGTMMTLTSISERGWDAVDDEGNELQEMGLGNSFECNFKKYEELL